MPLSGALLEFDNLREAQNKKIWTWMRRAWDLIRLTKWFWPLVLNSRNLLAIRYVIFVIKSISTWCPEQCKIWACANAKWGGVCEGIRLMWYSVKYKRAKKTKWLGVGDGGFQRVGYPLNSTRANRDGVRQCLWRLLASGSHRKWVLKGLMWIARGFIKFLPQLIWGPP